MRVPARVLPSQSLCDFAPFEVGLEIDETVDHDRDPVTLSSCTVNQSPHLSLEIFSKVLGLSPQTSLWLVQLAWGTSPRPINVVVSDRDQNQIGETLHN